MLFGVTRRSEEVDIREAGRRQSQQRHGVGIEAEQVVVLAQRLHLKGAPILQVLFPQDGLAPEACLEFRQRGGIDAPIRPSSCTGPCHQPAVESSPIKRVGVSITNRLDQWKVLVDGEQPGLAPYLVEATLHEQRDVP